MAVETGKDRRRDTSSITHLHPKLLYYIYIYMHTFDEKLLSTNAIKESTRCYVRITEFYIDECMSKI